MLILTRTNRNILIKRTQLKTQTILLLKSYKTVIQIFTYSSQTRLVMRNRVAYFLSAKLRARAYRGRTTLGMLHCAGAFLMKFLGFPQSGYK